MTRNIVLFSLFLIACVHEEVFAQTNTNSVSDRYTFGISGSMGASIVNPPDVVNFWNSFGGVHQQMGSWTLGGEFAIAPEVRLSERVGLKLEYGYQLFSNSFDDVTLGGHYEFNTSTHMPTLIVQYLFPAESYIFKIGGGVGYSFVNFDYESPITAGFIRSTASGIALKAEAEGQTAFSEHVYLQIAGGMRFSFIGKLHGGYFDLSETNQNVTFNFISFGASLGLVYYF